MRQLLLGAFCLALCGLAACTPKPLTDSEFRGFCYTSGGGRNTSCDNIELCNVYDSDVMSVQFASRQACNKACNDVYNALSGPNQFNGCMPIVVTGFNWCAKYCNTNYPDAPAR